MPSNAPRATEEVAGVTMTVADVARVGERAVADPDQILSHAQPSRSPPPRNPNPKRLLKPLQWKLTTVLNNQQERKVQPKTALQRLD